MSAAATVSIFRSTFPASPERLFFSPGRVNLIGEHTDYNGGLVLPAAISLGTYFAVSRSDQAEIKLSSSLEKSVIGLPLHRVSEFTPNGDWGDYARGVLKLLGARVGSPTGLNIALSGDLPIGAGLSSSASFTCGFISVINEAWNLKLTPLDTALLARQVENDFVGVQCGIMDQFAVTHGTMQHAIALDCNTLDHELIPLQMDGREFVIVDSGVERTLGDSAYNRRREECESALRLLDPDGAYHYLCDITPEQLSTSKALNQEAVLLKRATHAIEENHRVKRSVAALKENNLEQFGREMSASHRSLRDNFEVSCQELDLLVEIALNSSGVLGSRMTGAGFGGCTVTLVDSDAVESLSQSIAERYTTVIGIEPNIIRCETGNAAGRIPL